MFADPLTERLVAFVRGIGIDVRAADAAGEDRPARPRHPPRRDPGRRGAPGPSRRYPARGRPSRRHRSGERDAPQLSPTPATRWPASPGLTPRCAISSSIRRSSSTPTATRAGRRRSSRISRRPLFRRAAAAVLRHDRRAATRRRDRRRTLSPHAALVALTAKGNLPWPPAFSSPTRSRPPPCRSSRIAASRSISSPTSARTRTSSPRSSATTTASRSARPPR